MADYPYTTVPGKLKPLLEKMRQTGIPRKATAEWLASLGFRSSNDRSMIPALRVVGLIDSAGAPTQLWKDYRGGNYRSVLAQSLRTGYEELFQTYPDAHERTTQELESFFSTKSTQGRQVVSKIAATFKALADSSSFAKHDDITEPEPPPALELLANVPTTGTASKTPAANVTINVNVQLALPETTEAAVYDKLFAAMKKHLLSEGDSNA